MPTICSCLLMVTVCWSAMVTAVAQDAPLQMMEATFKLYNKDSTATGFLLRPSDGEPMVLVTAAHVFKGMSGDEAILVLRQPKDDGSWERKDHRFPVRAQGKDLWTTHPKYDVAVMRLTLPENALVKPLPLSCLADEAAILKAKVQYGSSLRILGYPTRFEANKAGFPILRHGSIASHPLVPVGPHPTFLADFTTFSGDSGGPVIHVGEATAAPLVLGIVLSQHRNDEKIVSMYEERTIHTPLMLSDILHATYIRETIALLPAP